MPEWIDDRIHTNLWLLKTCWSRNPVAVENTGFRNYALTQLVAHSDDAIRLLLPPFVQLQAPLPARAGSMAHPSPVTDACASDDNTQSTIAAGALHVARSARLRHSGNSLRMLPMNRSTYGFCPGL